MVFSCGCLCAGGRVRACVCSGQKKNRRVGGGGGETETERAKNYTARLELRRRETDPVATPASVSVRLPGENWPAAAALRQLLWLCIQGKSLLWFFRPVPARFRQRNFIVVFLVFYYLFVVVVRCCFFFFFFFSSSSHPDNYNRTGWLGVTETLTKLLTYSFMVFVLLLLFLARVEGGGGGRVGFVGFVSCSCWWWVFCWC